MPKPFKPGKYFNDKFARYIRRLLKHHGMPWLVKEYGISSATIHRWASGRFLPSGKTLYLKVHEDFYKSPEFVRNEGT